MVESLMFDVFLCHNSQDKPEVRNIGQQLRQLELNPWLDEWHLQPGLPWQRELERQIKNIRACAVFVGNSGFGPWQEMEIEAYLRRFVKQMSPVIPVLLSNAPEQPELPPFLEGMTWVDFRQSEPDPMERLIWGITGINPQIKNSTREFTGRKAELDLEFQPDKLIETIFDTLLNPDIEEAIQTFEGIAHKSLFANGKIKSSFFQNYFIPAREKASKYKRPVEIIEIQPTQKTWLGGRQNREEGIELDCEVTRDSALNHISGHIRFFIPKNSQMASISYIVL